MRRMLCYTGSKMKLLNRARVVIGYALLVLSATSAFAGTPDWLKRAAQAPLPTYADDSDAVVLLDETTTTVSPSGEVHTTHRKAFKILRPEGRDRGVVHVYFDNETRLTYLKAWSVTPGGVEYEIKEGDAVETQAFSESLYDDTKYKSFRIPGADIGSVIGYEYQQRERSALTQKLWMFQDEIPVRQARFILELPTSWTYSACWRNHANVAPQAAGENRWVWELADIEAITSEPKMPSWRSVAGELGVSFFPKPSGSNPTWAQVGKWYADLTAGRRDSTPEIKDKVHKLIVGTTDPYEKLRRLASFVQHDIRYVAIEIGIGGYQPHSAAEVLANRYGDCKDKATLLSAMLGEAGLDSYYVLINDERDFLSTDFASPLNFNHVILAIRPPQQVDRHTVFATLPHPALGLLLFFDPTDSSTPVGYLPPSLQANYGLLVHDGGELVQLPVLAPGANKIVRTAKLSIDASGKLTGTAHEVRTGPAASELRDELLAVPNIQRQKVFQSLVSGLSTGATLTSASVTDLGDFTTPLVIDYGFTIDGYAQHPAQLLLLRPCALGHKGDDLLEQEKPRRQPVIFSNTAFHSDSFEVSFPGEYSIDELPKPVQLENSFAAYTSQSRVENHVLRYSRMYQLKSIRVSLEQMNQLKEFLRSIADDERAYAILNTVAVAHP